MKQVLLFLFAGAWSMHTSAQVLTDPSLETSGPANSPWSSTSSNFGTSFCDLASCGTCGGPCVPNTGLWYAWFGGTTNAETGTIAQGFNATTTGAGTLTYYLKVPMKGAIGDTLSVLLDGVAISKTNTVDSIGAYQETTLNVGAITMGSHNLTIRFQKQASAAVVNVLVDDIQLTIGGTVSVEEIDFSNGIQISNNIESGEITVAYNFNENQNVRLSVTDITGKVVYNGQFSDQTANQHIIHSNDWSSGMYNVTLTSDKGLVKTKKVVVN
ncbi:T9SS type A sorting domain-containing protein [Fluviicola sp.]|uniref:T9SS type A sorting domain-containing protein n=1 Tax=Fluviicola sp. TaxID=1917219 RepID=UPI002632C41F|nr:T9SS type A sorting domain-containing protein [Fluviicola sp.]